MHSFVLILLPARQQLRLYTCYGCFTLFARAARALRPTCTRMWQCLSIELPFGKTVEMARMTSQEREREVSMLLTGTSVRQVRLCL